jgi:peptide/nickel transport system permease protein
VLRDLRGYLRRNPELIVGVSMFALLVLFWIIGPSFIDTDKARPLSVIPDMPPSEEYPLGTETVGRDMLSILLVGTRYSFQIGLIAGTVGLTVGTLLGFIAGYFGGLTDSLIRGAADVGLTIPTLAVLVVIAAVIKTLLTPTLMALIIAMMAWMHPTRTIRSQVLSMRERPWVEIARLSGLNNVKIIFGEILPNLLPYLASSFVGAVSSGLLAAIGLEALGLGPQTEPTLGMTIFWSNYYGALLRGMWWWWVPPILAIAWVFISLFMVSSGLDELANPRLRRAV